LAEQQVHTEIKLHYYKQTLHILSVCSPRWHIKHVCTWCIISVTWKLFWLKTQHFSFLNWFWAGSIPWPGLPLCRCLQEGIRKWGPTACSDSNLDLYQNRIAYDSTESGFSHTWYW